MTRAPANTSAEEQAIRVAVDAWARARWGADLRAIHELSIGRRRIDAVFVSPTDVVGVEVKGPRDSLGDGRVLEQMAEFALYLPEVWLVVDSKWRAHKHVVTASYRWNVAMHEDGKIVVPKRLRYARDARRDDLCCSRLLELLWHSETYAIAQRTTVAYEAKPGLRFPAPKVKGMLARMLTGHEIVKEVCRELRSRPLVGMQSDEAMERRPTQGLLADMNRVT